jgi:hypothetical protein
VVFAVADLHEAIRDVANPRSEAGQLAIYGRLRAAFESEWAGRALANFVVDPDRFLFMYFDAVVEHGEAAALDEESRAFFDALVSHRASPAGKAGREGENKL